VLDADDPAERGPWILLQYVPASQAPVGSGTHLDFRVDDVALAVEHVEAIGGSVVRAPGFYAPDRRDLLEWAVMRDPFGNDFCLIRCPLGMLNRTRAQSARRTRLERRSRDGHPRDRAR
jgi:hypothetical protein